MFFYYISEVSLYLCFSLLMGTFIFSLVPSHKKPTVFVRKRWLQLALLGIVFFSAIPALRVVLFLNEGVGLSLTLNNVLTNFEVGKAWSFILILSIFYYFYLSVFPVQQKVSYSILALVFLFILILAIGWSSHAASLTEWTGFVSHTVHLTAVSIWIGVLFIISWFSTSTKNWRAFLSWFSPLAFICFAFTILSGLILMDFVVDIRDYANAWMLDYGQALLFKHLLIIPLLIFACINGVWINRKLKKDETFNPKPWTKAESLVLLFIFSATAVLGQQAPPHDIPSTLRADGVSDLFQYFYGGQVEMYNKVQFSFTSTSLVLFVLSFFFLLLLLYTFVKKAPAIFSFLMSLFFVLSAYLGLMTSIQ
ncbi:copper resistance D family protein [Alkalihalophilus marmarensis]|uniref:copper resistance D family protein n=1 Tax=Alkalihalophilus marmarensis TaxID=521377 RepID=UPI002DBE8D21|nr:CopD family protein [Alkalihalophilus marmarensis]MEC2074408.1 CopD family protein [Alkalihalophilus marmarensis]